MHTSESGILRFAPYDRQETLKSDVRLCLADLFDSIDVVHSNARELESTIDDIFFGSRCERSERSRR